MSVTYAPYAVEAYSIQRLVELIAVRTNNPLFFIEQKNHVGFFEEYFGPGGLNAKTILVESDYIDRDFLEDFAAYYVRCFSNYERFCTRLHFFDKAFSDEDFARVLEGTETTLSRGDLDKAYLGFIVLKRLPKYVLGRTCLKAYPEERGRKYPIQRKYEANPFGLPLSVTTLAFQEQDTTAAACATSTLWAIFQGTGKLFNHEIPSPVRITEIASRFTPSFLRTFPNHGLTILQMINAMRSVGLEPLVMDFKPPAAAAMSEMKALLYAYLKAGIPIALGVRIPALGGHAVAVTGFKLGSAVPPVSFGKQTRFLSESLETIYVHDDQLGPFSRVEFDGPSALKLNWKNGTGRGMSTEPIVLIIPLYHKIRIPLELIMKAVSAFYDGLSTLPSSICAPFGITPSFSLVWDLHLTTATSLKAEISETTFHDSAVKRELLTLHLPKYIWRAKGVFEGVPYLDLLFDATDVEMGRVFVKAIHYHESFSRFLRTVSPFASKLLSKSNDEKLMIAKSIFDSIR